jgi:hypothetical protein
MAKKSKSNSKETRVSGRPSSLIDTRVIYSSEAMSEIQSFFKKTGKTIIALTVKDILDEQIAYKLA